MTQFEDKTLLQALKAHNGKGIASFQMPGHKRDPRFAHLMGIEGVDITETYGFDNLHRASGILKRVNDMAAETYGVRASRMLVGGSTSGILAAVRALTARGDGILIARNCHGSVYNAAEICALDMHYVMPSWNKRGFFGSLSPSAVEDALKESPNIKLAVVTSPTYEGVISDIAGIAEICRRYGVRLLVDEAHGAHLGFGAFAPSARGQGADIVVNSLHKTLPSLTQTAILHVCSNAVPSELIDEQLAAFETSSPSYPFMASVDGCIRYLQGGDISKWSNAVLSLRESLSALERISLYGGEDEYGYDISKLTLISHGKLSGVQLMDVLYARYGIELEMAGLNYAIAMCGAGDTPEMYSRLKKALFELENADNSQNTIPNNASFENSPLKSAQNENAFLSYEARGEGRAHIARTLRNVGDGAMDAEGALMAPILPDKAMNACDAREMPFELVPIDAAEGRISAENIRAYPPGCPVIVKGERISASALAALLRLEECGVEVSGSRGSFPQNIAVVA